MLIISKILLIKSYNNIADNIAVRYVGIDYVAFYCYFVYLNK